MRVLKFLNTALSSGTAKSASEALDLLTEHYAIKSKFDEKYHLYVLNYCQINSPKFRPITNECRSLVLSYSDNEFKLVSRAFDRFFNLREKRLPCTTDKLVFHEKLDGSLVTIFYHKGMWLYRTKSMIMPTGLVNGLAITWKELIEVSLGWNSTLKSNLIEDLSYIFEVVSPFNRIVTRYTEPEAYLLSVRNIDGSYESKKELDSVSSHFLWKRPKLYSFLSWDECENSALSLKDLKEGYVGYLKNQPIVKVKNPAYLAAHYLRGEEAVTPKRIVNLILINETDEYLSIFPEDTMMFQPYIDAYLTFKVNIDRDYKNFTLNSRTRKEFAKLALETCYSTVLFKMYNNTTRSQAFKSLTRNEKHSIIMSVKYNL